jgi:hypothetical protein
MHESWEDNISKEEQWSKINIDKGDRRTLVKKSHNHCSTGERAAELNIHLEDPSSTKTVLRELHNSSIHGSSRAAIPNF